MSWGLSLLYLGYLVMAALCRACVAPTEGSVQKVHMCRAEIGTVDIGRSVRGPCSNSHGMV